MLGAIKAAQGVGCPVGVCLLAAVATIGFIAITCIAFCICQLEDLGVAEGIR